MEREGSASKAGDAGQRLFLLGVEHVQDGAGQQGVSRLVPVIAAVAGAFGINEDVGDVLHIAHFLRALAHFQQRIEAGGAGIGWVKAQTV